MHGHEHAALGTGLADVPALDVAREYDGRLLVQDLALMDVPQRPVVVSLGNQSVDRAGGIVAVTIATRRAGMQQTDVEAALLGDGIGFREVFGNCLGGEAL